MKNLAILIGLGLLVLSSSLNSCKKEGVPTVTTLPVTNIRSTAATSGGTINNEGSGIVIARGVCWNTSQNPSTSNGKTMDNTGTGSFISNITGLSPNTTYYVSAYATNSAGTGYGMAMSFTTLLINCKYCKQVAYVNGLYDHDITDTVKYCEAELIAIEATPNLTIGNTTVKWECSYK